MCTRVFLYACENYPSRYAAAPSFRAGRIAEVLGRKAVAAATACVAGRRDVVADAAAVAVAAVNPRGASPSREFRTVGWTALWGPWSEIQVVGLVCVVCVCVFNALRTRSLLDFRSPFLWLGNIFEVQHVFTQETFFALSLPITYSNSHEANANVFMSQRNCT